MNKIDLRKIKKEIPKASHYSAVFLENSEFCFEVNLSKNIIEKDFGRTNGEGPHSIPSFLGLSVPCSFTEFTDKWLKKMTDLKGESIEAEFTNLPEKLIASYETGQKEYSINYWGTNFSNNSIFYNQRFLISKNENEEKTAFCIFKDITKTRNADVDNLIEKLNKLEYRDPLTQGYNYQKFKKEVNKDLVSGSIIIIDIQNFKIVNSLCGIATGDKVIKAIWDSILLNVDFTKKEKAGHINADKFVLFYPTVKKDEISEKIKNLTLGIRVCSIEMDVPALTPFFGITEWEPGKKIEESITEAIIAKNKAKEIQSTKYIYFDKESSKVFKREKMLLDSFEEAMIKKEFRIWFQPKFSPNTSKLEGAEALVRWYKDGTIISPGEFIPLFEKNNLIRDLDEFVFRSVCEYQKSWMNSGYKIVPISVNLSRASLYYCGLVDRYKTITQKVGIDPLFVPIEITETAEVKNSQVEESVRLFHEAGFSLQMDDFGSGYSSLSTLNTLLFDTIKIDKSLVDYIGTLNGDRLIAHTISLAKELNIKTTAEGVENKTQAHFLRNNGCDSIQGYYYSKPIDYGSFQELVKQNKLHLSDLKKIESNEKIFNFIQNFERPPICTVTLNLTNKEVIDIPNARLYGAFKELSSGNYNEIINQYSEEMDKSVKEKFIQFMNMQEILESYKKGELTNVFEYKIKGEKNMEIKLRILRYTFRFPENDNIICFLKFQKIN